MEMLLGCAHLSDDEFVTAFEECRLEPANFHHADHVRLAWIYAGHYRGAAAEAKLLRGIRHLAAKAGVPGKFRHTTTVAWARLVAASRTAAGAQQAFGEWITSHPEFLERRLLEKYYSQGRLDSEAARNAWIAPDLTPLL